MIVWMQWCNTRSSKNWWKKLEYNSIFNIWKLERKCRANFNFNETFTKKFQFSKTIKKRKIIDNEYENSFEMNRNKFKRKGQKIQHEIDVPFEIDL